MKKVTLGAMACLIFLLGSFNLTGGTGTQQVSTIKKRIIQKPKMKKNTKSARADLVVNRVQITPDQPRALKDMITIKVKVKNTGAVPTPIPASLTMSVYSVDSNGNRTTGDSNLNAIPWYTNNIPVLNPNQSVKISKTITCNHPGPHEVSGVIITEGFEAGDENSQNNSYKKTFQVRLPPQYADLVLNNFYINSAGVLVMKMCNKGASVPNQDFVHSQVRVYVDNDPYKTLMFPDVDPTGIVKKGRGPMPIGPAKYLIFKWPTSGYQGLQFTAGQTYTIRVVLNYNNCIYDNKPHNNSKTKTITFNP